MAQNDIGIDLGTTTIIIAQEGKGVVLNQPSVVAMDTRKNTVLEAGDKALAMVGRTPNYISAIFPLKDGVISDHTMTRPPPLPALKAMPWWRLWWQPVPVRCT